MDKKQLRRLERKYEYYSKILADEKRSKKERVEALEMIRLLVFIKTGIDIYLKIVYRSWGL